MENDKKELSNNRYWVEEKSEFPKLLFSGYSDFLN